MTLELLQRPNTTGEPAFVSHQEALRHKRSYGPYKSLTDGCFSISNLALILAAIVALVFSARFLYDEPLYEYPEQLLSLRFYRQLVYIIVILPLTLLVPIFNAASALFLSHRLKLEMGTAPQVVKLTYQVLMAVLVFIGLAFVAPSIRSGTVSSQIGLELREHIRRRYENNFSYEFLDRIQNVYQCCDEIWYRENNFDKLPLSCFELDGLYQTIHQRTCAEVLGSLVSNRCAIIAASLVLLLIALAALIWIDILELVSHLTYVAHYDVAQRECHLADSGSGRAMKRAHHADSRLPSKSWRDNESDDDDSDDEDFVQRQEIREREPSSLDRRTQAREDSMEAGEIALDDEVRTSCAQREPPILTRASYLTPSPDDRPRSPVFLSHIAYGEETGATKTALRRQTGANSPPKGVLKKSSSRSSLAQQRELCDTNQAEDNESRGRGELDEFQWQLQRDLQARRPMLNVRFAE